jgi:hypothetical protein
VFDQRFILTSNSYSKTHKTLAWIKSFLKKNRYPAFKQYSSMINLRQGGKKSILAIATLESMSYLTLTISKKIA